MANLFSTLEKNILTAKGVTAEQVAALEALGVASKEDLAIVSDPATLVDLLPGIQADVAGKVMTWATGRTVQVAAAAAASASGGFTAASGRVLLDTADVVYCTHCSAKQPKDYKSGDLCTACGRQAEPILSCFWCGSAGPGSFCRACGARFVPMSELELALLLRQEGLPKDEIPRRLQAMEPTEKDLLWGRVRRHRA